MYEQMRIAYNFVPTALMRAARDGAVSLVEALLDAEEAADEARHFRTTRKYHNVHEGRGAGTHVHFSAFGRYDA